MKKRILFVLLVAALFGLLGFLTGCSEIFPSDGRYVVTDVRSKDPLVFKYRMEPITGKGLLYVEAAAYTFLAGDTVTFCDIADARRVKLFPAYIEPVDSTLILR